jgi:TatD DNase family protein
MFTGLYRGKTLHESDLDQVVQRAKERGVERMIITGTSLEGSREAVELAKRYSPYASNFAFSKGTVWLKSRPESRLACDDRLSSDINIRNRWA